MEHFSHERRSSQSFTFFFLSLKWMKVCCLWFMSRWQMCVNQSKSSITIKANQFADSLTETDKRREISLSFFESVWQKVTFSVVLEESRTTRLWASITWRVFDNNWWFSECVFGCTNDFILWSRWSTNLSSCWDDGLMMRVYSCWPNCNLRFPWVMMIIIRTTKSRLLSCKMLCTENNIEVLLHFTTDWMSLRSQSKILVVKPSDKKQSSYYSWHETLSKSSYCRVKRS